ncbi:putative MFS family arabinose efflux permease [Lentzea atacamensis]|uniref:MFS family arabinose efflux permease n=1 Tax=Lentzea atacamensis TaxID=531938 RepID=A0ABX9E9F7_9PSEU|nr:MFS transporter [Lentzea atacamensis]RAS64811.1 putative MFS family arabinose efflux permease [Lentzea atacamensis]
MAKSVRSPMVLAVLLAGSTLGVMGGAILVSVLEVIRGEFAVSGTAAGFILTAHGLAIALSSPLMGRLVDRWGIRPPLIGGLVVYALAGGAGLVVTSYPALIVSRLVFGVGAAAVFTCTTVALLAFFQGAERDRVMGWRSTATSVGGLVWPLLGGVLGGLSWHATFGIYLVGIPLALAAMWSLPNTTPPDRHNQTGAILLLRQRPALLGWYAMWIVIAVQMYVLAIFLPQHLARLGIHAPVLVAIYAVVGPSITTSLIGLVYGRLRARFGYTTLLRVAFAASLAGFLLYATVTQPVLLLLAPALFGVGNGILFPIATVLVDQAAGAEHRGRAASLSGTAIFSGQFMSPLLFGPLIAATSTTTGFLVAATISATLLVIVVVGRVGKHRLDEEDRAGALNSVG